MGYGEYSHAAHIAITSSRAAPREPVFRQDHTHPLLRPNEVPGGVVRECRDSDDHPDSLGVVFALDVSGSMGEIPQLLATRTLPDFMRVLLDAGLHDPQVCFMAVGHAGDRAPLQVGQFESTAALIDLWLTRLWLEGGGVGQHEAYELAMLFAARRMRLDSVEKRGRRGYLFVTGDTAPNPAVSRVEAERVLGEALPNDLPIRDLIEELGRTFEPFFLVAPGTPRRADRAWRDLLGDRVIRLVDAEDTAQVAAGLVALLEGAVASLAGYVDRLVAAGVPRRQAVRVGQALVPFSASIDRDGAPAPSRRGTELPRGARPSGVER